MKYRDLLAAEVMDRDQLTKVVGGESWGQHLSGLIGFFGEGFANLPHIKALEAESGLTNLGQFIQDRSGKFGYPGLNGIKALDVSIGIDIKLPPGLPPG